LSGSPSLACQLFRVECNEAQPGREGQRFLRATVCTRPLYIAGYVQWSGRLCCPLCHGCAAVSPQVAAMTGWLECSVQKTCRRWASPSALSVCLPSWRHRWGRQSVGRDTAEVCSNTARMAKCSVYVVRLMLALREVRIHVYWTTLAEQLHPHSLPRLIRKA